MTIYLSDFFFLSGFSLQTLTIHRAAGEGRGTCFTPLCHFHPLTNIEILICNFACEMTTRIFNCNACVYQTATRWDLPPYRITIWAIDWWCNVCLFTWWIEIRFLLQRFDTGNQPVDLNSHRLSLLNYKRTDKPRVLEICDSATVRTLSIIFKNCLQSGSAVGLFLITGKIQNIVPIHNKGDKQLLQNYWPVSLLINIQLLKWEPTFWKFQKPLTRCVMRGYYSNLSVLE